MAANRHTAYRAALATVCRDLLAARRPGYDATRARALAALWLGWNAEGDLGPDDIDTVLSSGKWPTAEEAAARLDEVWPGFKERQAKYPDRERERALLDAVSQLLRRYEVIADDAGERALAQLFMTDSQTSLNDEAKAYARDMFDVLAVAAQSMGALEAMTALQGIESGERRGRKPSAALDLWRLLCHERGATDGPMTASSDGAGSNGGAGSSRAAPVSEEAAGASGGRGVVLPSTHSASSSRAGGEAPARRGEAAASAAASQTVSSPKDAAGPARDSFAAAVPSSHRATASIFTHPLARVQSALLGLHLSRVRAIIMPDNMARPIQPPTAAELAAFKAHQPELLRVSSRYVAGAALRATIAPVASTLGLKVRQSRQPVEQPSAPQAQLSVPTGRSGQAAAATSGGPAGVAPAPAVAAAGVPSRCAGDTRVPAELAETVVVRMLESVGLLLEAAERSEAAGRGGSGSSRSSSAGSDGDS